MASELQEIVGGKDLAAKSSEVDFAIVLSRVIGSMERDPAQLRSAVYELARIKLQTELSINVSEKRDLALALESAIERGLRRVAGCAYQRASPATLAKRPTLN
jgi:hypothetical protein